MKRNILTATKTFVKDHPWISVAIKFAVTIACLWYVSHKIDWLLTLQLLNDSNKWWLLTAAFFFTLSKLVAAFRLNIYFKNIEVRLAQTNNIKLYWLGMFYNLFLPGGIVKEGEAFYRSLGYPELPATFWQKSSLYPLPTNANYKKNNHASAWHIDLQQDVRSLMSVEPNT